MFISEEGAKNVISKNKQFVVRVNYLQSENKYILRINQLNLYEMVLDKTIEFDLLLFHAIKVKLLKRFMENIMCKRIAAENIKGSRELLNLLPEYLCTEFQDKFEYMFIATIKQCLVKKEDKKTGE